MPAPRPEAVPARDGRWLVLDGDRRFVVSGAVARRLARPDGEPWWRRRVGPSRDAGAGGAPHAGPRLRVPLLPGRWNRWAAGLLAPSTSWPALVGMAVAGVVALAFTPEPPAPPTTGQYPVVVLLVLSTALIHEWGHAAALRREGWPCGTVGLGLLHVIPVLWCDVSAVAVLSRSGRARVDVAGVCFQLGAAGLLATVGAAGPWPAVGWAARSGALLAAWNVLPVARTDGYWLVADLLDLADPERPLPPDAGRSRRLAAAVWRWSMVAGLGMLLALAPWRLAAWLGGGNAVALALTALGVWRFHGRGCRLLAAVATDLGWRRPSRGVPAGDDQGAGRYAVGQPGREGAMGDDHHDDAEIMPVDGVLDLHMFRPAETRDLVADYLNLCRERGILDVRIIHGKGVGVQREIVHGVLRRHPAVESFGHPGDQGSWGATVVRLRPVEED
jgi:hypothetical protein